MTTIASLAEDLEVDPGDVRVIADRIGVEGDELHQLDCGHIRAMLDPHGERTVPEMYYAAPRDPRVCRCPALGGLEHSPGPRCP